MDISWLIIGILVVVAFLLLRFKEVRHRIGLFTIILLLLFFIISIGYVTKVNHVNVSTFDGVAQVSQFYFVWLKGVAKNLVGITGYAIKQNWAINATNITNIGKIKK